MDNESNSSQSNLDLAGALGALLSNPESMEKISKIISSHTNNNIGDVPPPSTDNSVQNSEESINNLNLSNESNPPSTTSQNSENLDFSKILPVFSSLLSSQSTKISSPANHQKNLLLAIKPYLSDHRKELIDTFIKFSQLSEILKNLT